MDCSAVMVLAYCTCNCPLMEASLSLFPLLAERIIDSILTNTKYYGLGEELDR